MLDLRNLLCRQVPGPVERDRRVARKEIRDSIFHPERQTVDDHQGENIPHGDHLPSGYALEVDFALAGPTPNRRPRDSQVADGLWDGPELVRILSHNYIVAEQLYLCNSNVLRNGLSCYI